MSDIPNLPGLPAPLAVTRATASHRPILERLWLPFSHDMSKVNGALPNPDGTYRAERLTRALTDPTWCAWLMTAGEHPVGFAIVRALDQRRPVVNSFFIVKPARRRGLGLTLARSILGSHPGAWQVAYQDANKTAACFWPALASTLDPHWRHEHRPVPDRPDLPADSWILFDAE